MANDEQQQYQSFLIRCWSAPREREDQPAEWRFELRLIAAETESYKFGSYQQLMEFVAHRLGTAAGADELS